MMTHLVIRRWKLWFNNIGLTDRITEEFLNNNRRLIGLSGYPLMYDNDDDTPCYKEVESE